MPKITSRRQPSQRMGPVRLQLRTFLKNLRPRVTNRPIRTHLPRFRNRPKPQQQVHVMVRPRRTMLNNADMPNKLVTRNTTLNSVRHTGSPCGHTGNAPNIATKGSAFLPKPLHIRTARRINRQSDEKRIPALIPHFLTLGSNAPKPLRPTSLPSGSL